MYSYCYNEIIVPKKKEGKRSEPTTEFTSKKHTISRQIKENRESIKRELKGALTL